jgi:hypothetical protein
MAYNNKAKKKYPPRPGGMWVKKTKKGQKMYTVSLRADALPEPDEKGFIKLIGFVNDRKEQDSHPDINLMVPKEQNGNGYKRRNDEDEEDETPRKAKASRRPVEEDTDEDSEAEDGTDDDEDEDMPF